MARFQLNVNGQSREVSADPSTPLLWVLREDLKMTGTKYGCGVSACGACTVHGAGGWDCSWMLPTARVRVCPFPVAGFATRSCMLPIALLGDRPVVTIEAMDEDPVGRVVQDAW